MGRLLYLNLSKPDISFSVQQLSQYMSCPRKPYIQDALHVVRYLKGTTDLELFYPKEGATFFTAFSDADRGSCAFSGKSLIGYYVFLGNSLVSWKTKKPKAVSKSSCESELRSMSMTTSELSCLDHMII